MSVLIKGMEMPSECEYCPLCRYYSESKNVWCNALNVILKRQWNYVLDPHLNVPRREDCPLVEVPTPHGRLIDADKLYDKFAELDAEALERTCKLGEQGLNEEWRKWSAILTERTAFKHDVYDAPTVIEADMRGKRSRYEREAEQI